MRTNNRHLRVGLQPKVIITLAVVVIGAVSSGVWFYFTASAALLDSSDRQHALRTAQTLGQLAAGHITQGRQEDLRRVVEDFSRTASVAYAAVVGEDGEVLARSSRDGKGAVWDGQLLNLPPSMSSMSRYGNVLALAQPIVVGGEAGSSGRLVGSVRLVLDVSQTAASLVKARQRMWAAAAGITLCAIPLGYLLVWRVIVQPVRRLAAATHRLAGGDYSARTSIRRNDELGALATAFDAMADQLDEARLELLHANRLLEKKVADRTRRLETANTRLQEEITDKEALLRTVSHDLSAPLRNISGMAGMTLLRCRAVLPDDVCQRLERIQANADTEIAMISDLLEVSRIRTCRRECQTVQVGRLLDDLARKFEYELTSRQVALEVAGDMPDLYIEAPRITQVFQNLIDNAIKYMDKTQGGKIAVSYQLDGLWHEFRVTDNGPGVPTDQQREVFCIFRRAQTPHTTSVPGKGIGLAVVAAVASGYGGKAWVESRKGGGASFCFTLAVDQTSRPGARQVAKRCGSSGVFRVPIAAGATGPAAQTGPPGPDKQRDGL